ncbi:hypothetical protein [Hoylesella nanceiensis]|jgi:hypothetical protein|uniref:hypothetical protein n=1 Tax=Hoylesella nanceiensis TaxID=425941 RepID=UPI00037AA424|nr:hypothetical protein [Hoylesella nanceiensis]MBF1420520.1 hypothetical protein [Hoylesella nanceiensis]MBF1432224.1 hypothetical protein [Hoylesella nanceiensis]MBW4767477.1 hypothetical protein [Hoylesella nanceiensis]MBW4834110.1 hypothetical protein [Hoylesella nanceiensis]
MTNNEKVLAQFAARIQQLILQYKDIKKENAELYAMIEGQEEKIKTLEEHLSQAQNDYQSLKIARMIEVSDVDVEKAQQRLAKLIRDVNKCITLLSEK